MEKSYVTPTLVIVAKVAPATRCGEVKNNVGETPVFKPLFAGCVGFYL